MQWRLTCHSCLLKNYSRRKIQVCRADRAQSAHVDYCWRNISLSELWIPGVVRNLNADDLAAKAARAHWLQFRRFVRWGDVRISAKLQLSISPSWNTVDWGRQQTP